MRIRDPGWRQFGSGIRDGKRSDRGSGIQDKHPGSATLAECLKNQSCQKVHHFFLQIGRIISLNNKLQQQTTETNHQCCGSETTYSGCFPKKKTRPGIIMRSSRVVKASEYQCKGILDSDDKVEWRGADEEVIKVVSNKNPPFKKDALDVWYPVKVIARH